MEQEKEFREAVAALMEKYREVSAGYVLAKFQDDNAVEWSCPPGKTRVCVSDPNTGQQICYCV